MAAALNTLSLSVKNGPLYTVTARCNLSKCSQVFAGAKLKRFAPRVLSTKYGGRQVALVRAAAEVGEEVSSEAENTEAPVETPLAAAGEEIKASAPDAEVTPKPVRGAREARKITLNPNDIVVGNKYKGVVRSVMSYGAFVDIGSFTDGLVHISELSEGFVRNIEDFVNKGDELTVYVKELDVKGKRISLSIFDPAVGKPERPERRTEPSSEQEGREERPVGERKVAGRGNKRSGNRDAKKINHGFKVGQVVEGVIKDFTSFGAFIELKEGVQGLLHSSEVAVGAADVPMDTQFSLEQKVEVRIIEVKGNKINLTMKPEVDVGKLNSGVQMLATNPFQVAFRKYNLVQDEDIAALQAASDSEDVIQLNLTGKEEEIKALTEVATPEQEEPSIVAVEDAVIVEEPLAEESTPAVAEAVVEEPAPAVAEVVVEEPAPAEAEVVVEESAPVVAEAVVEEPAPVVSEAVVSEDPVVEEPAAVAVETPIVEEVVAEVLAVEEVPVPEDPVVEEPVASIVEEAPIVEEPATVVAEVPIVEEPVPVAEVVPVVEEPAPVVEDPVVDEPAPVVAEVSVIAEKAEEAAPIVAEETKQSAADSISAAVVKALREETGAGMMACKSALKDSGGDVEKAKELLRKKGLASAEKKASRAATEGVVHSYIHDGRIGVLLEVNCETDFVARGADFKNLVKDLGMQIAACPEVSVVSVDEIPAEIAAKEREIEMQREDLLSKPEAIRGKIVDGRMAKALNKFALLEQPFIKDDKLLVKDVVKQAVAKLGENIQVRRFQRFNLGEGLEKKSSDFAAEVAAASVVKAAPPPPQKEEEVQPAAPAVAVSAALVKQLREQTGAGMMDCKKALSASENDLEKASDFLRKKGLASADKKASRAASEGLVGSYIHDGRIGVLVEVNCETDFVARGEKFQSLVKELGMQIVACPNVTVVNVEDIPAEVVEKEREIALGQEDLQKKPEGVRAKIVEGRMAKRLGELALLEQPYIKDDKLTVKELIKETVASLGENIKVRRFTRFNLGEGLEKKSTDFSAEVAGLTKGN